MGFKGNGSSVKLNLVSFDTSSSSVHLALLAGDDVVASEILQTNLVASANSRQEAANLLIPAIDRLVREQNWRKSDIDAIVVGSGPGSFTGIRTSIVTARALAQALVVPLLPVSLLQCYFARVSKDSVVALQAAVGFYFVSRGGESFYFNEKEFKDFLAENSKVSHFGNSEAVTELQKSGTELELLPALDNVAVAQALIGLEQLQDALNDFNGDDSRSFLFEKFSYESVVPAYLRNPSVTIKESLKASSKVSTA